MDLLIEAKQIAGRSWLALRLIKVAVNNFLYTSLDTGLNMEQISQAIRFEQSEKDERVNSLFERRR